MRWAARNNAYPEAVEHLTRFIGDADLALQIFLPICFEAFHTSNPVRAFWTMTNAYSQMFPGSAGKGGRQAVRFRTNRVAAKLDVLPNEKADFSGADWEAFSTEMTYLRRPFVRLTMPQVLAMKLSATEFPHPTLYLLAHRWHLDALENRAITDVLRFPSLATKETFHYCFGTYQPPWTIGRFDLPTRTKIVSFGRLDEIDYVGRIERRGHGINGSAALVDMFTMFGAIRRATGAFYAEDMRLCPHVECPEYNFNYCNSWIFIHEHFNRCKFLKHFPWIQQTLLDVGKQMEEEHHG